MNDSAFTHTTSRKLLSSILFGALIGQSVLSAEAKTVFDFDEPGAGDNWFSVNDGVMGGISKGSFRITADGSLLFSGTLSLENNGGFASIRSRNVAIDLDGATALLVKARGDGRTYWAEIRERNQQGASSFRAYLPTVEGELKTIRIPLSDFKFQTFGRSIPMRALNTQAAQSIGFTIADKQPGDFRLTIESIGIDYGTATNTSGTIVDVASQVGSFSTLRYALDRANQSSFQ